MNLVDLLKLIWPLLVLQISFQIYALYHLFCHRHTRNLSVAIWVIIIVLGELLGPLFYFLLGSGED